MSLAPREAFALIHHTLIDRPGNVQRNQPDRFSQTRKYKGLNSYNLVVQLVWKKSYGGGAKTKHVVMLHEYILCYAKNKDAVGRIELPPDPKARRYYKYQDEKVETRGLYRLQPLATTSNDERANLRYAIPFKGEDIWPEKQWQWEKLRTLAALENNELVITKPKGEWSVNYKQYLRDEDGVERGAKPFSLLEGP